MAKVTTKIVHRIGTREVSLKGEAFLKKIVSLVGEAAEAQIKAVAEEARNLMMDRLYGARPFPPGQTVVSAPDKLGPGGVLDLGLERLPFVHVPLAEDTIARKARKGLDGRELIATGGYTYGITVEREETATGVRYVMRPTSQMLAAVHEYGSAARGIPARPHWRPTIHDITRMIRKLGPDIKARALRVAFRTMV